MNLQGNEDIETREDVKREMLPDSTYRTVTVIMMMMISWDPLETRRIERPPSYLTNKKMTCSPDAGNFKIKHFLWQKKCLLS